MDRPNRVCCSERLDGGQNDGLVNSLTLPRVGGVEGDMPQAPFIDRLEAMRACLAVRRIETSNQQGDSGARGEQGRVNGVSRRVGRVKRTHCALRDGSLRYADKPFTTQRPRAYSPELLQFYADLEMMGLTR